MQTLLKQPAMQAQYSNRLPPKQATTRLKIQYHQFYFLVHQLGFYFVQHNPTKKHARHTYEIFYISMHISDFCIINTSSMSLQQLCSTPGSVQ